MYRYITVCVLVRLWSYVCALARLRVCVRACLFARGHEWIHLNSHPFSHVCLCLFVRCLSFCTGLVLVFRVSHGLARWRYAQIYVWRPLRGSLSSSWARGGEVQRALPVRLAAVCRIEMV